jgi:hypothetical protein
MTRRETTKEDRWLDGGGHVSRLDLRHRRQVAGEAVGLEGKGESRNAADGDDESRRGILTTEHTEHTEKQSRNGKTGR